MMVARRSNHALQVEFGIARLREREIKRGLEFLESVGSAFGRC